MDIFLISLVNIQTLNTSYQTSYLSSFTKEYETNEYLTHYDLKLVSEIGKIKRLGIIVSKEKDRCSDDKYKLN